ncbi:MAG: hypothetical protein AAFQ58_23620 [Pseudomonadota bacterium]
MSIAYEDQEGRLHRTFGEPAYELFEPSNGKILERQFVEHGHEHRLGHKPSYQTFDPISGCVTFERWMEQNRLRPEGITSISRSADGKIKETVRRLDGRQHVEKYDHDAAVDTSEPSP